MQLGFSVTKVSLNNKFLCDPLPGVESTLSEATNSDVKAILRSDEWFEDPIPKPKRMITQFVLLFIRYTIGETSFD